MTKTHIANIFNAVLTLILGLYAYRHASNQNVVLLVPIIFAVVLIVFSQGVHYRDKAQTSMSLLLAFIQILLVVYILKNDLSFTEDRIPFMCYGVIFLTNLIALFYLFRQAKSLR